VTILLGIPEKSADAAAKPVSSGDDDETPDSTQ
jgi:hypothetical protein